jgi:hypothetical protein
MNFVARVKRRKLAHLEQDPQLECAVVHESASYQGTTKNAGYNASHCCIAVVVVRGKPTQNPA